MITAHPHFYLPNLSTFQNKNTFYGSLDELRFRVAYQEDEEAGKQFHVCTWPGPYCLAESEVTAEAVFPLDEEGYPVMTVPATTDLSGTGQDTQIRSVIFTQWTVAQSA